MLYWALVFLLFSVVAGLMGFSGIAAASAGMAQILFYIFIGFFLLAIITHFVRKADNTVENKL